MCCQPGIVFVVYFFGSQLRLINYFDSEIVGASRNISGKLGEKYAISIVCSGDCYWLLECSGVFWCVPVFLRTDSELRLRLSARRSCQ